MAWQYEKFKGEGGIYAICPRCNFKHYVGSAYEKEPSVCGEYNFCPICGEYHYKFTGDVEVAWNEREWTEVMQETCDVERYRR